MGEKFKLIFLSQRRFVQTAGTIWIIFAAALIFLAIVKPSRSLVPVYSAAAFNFWNGIEPNQNYEHGFFYLPASQIIFSPFAFTGVSAATILWALTCFGLLTVSIRAWARLLVPNHASLATAISLVLFIPGGASVLRNGQFDAAMWALIAIAAAQIAYSRLWSASIALTLAFALKPTAVVAVLLMGTVWPSIGLRLIPLIAATLALPFWLADMDFVWRLYTGWVDRIFGAVQTPGRWSDIANALKHGGLEVPFVIMTPIRGLMAVLTLIVAYIASRRLPRVFAAFSIFSLSTLFLLLFNPRTEGSGYAGFALVAGLLAARAAVVEDRTILATALAACCVALGLPGMFPWASKLLGIWMNPLLATIVLAAVVTPRALHPHLWDPAATQQLNVQKPPAA